MALLEILTAPDPRLNAKAFPVQKVDSSIRKLMDDLLETLYENHAVGFASMQAGIQKRVLAIDLGERNNFFRKPLLMANPELHWVSLETQITKEGCLSVPNVWVDIIRPLEAHVTYLDENNQRQHLKAKGLLADCIQHEIDHLNGILFIEHLTSLKRAMIMRKLLKNKKNKGSL